MPLFFRLQSAEDKDAFEHLTSSDDSISVHDEIEGQLKELIKSNNPSCKIKDSAYPSLIKKHLKGQNINEYGVWIFYPWSKRIIHLLDQDEFVEVRTNRNRYKITREEQNLLRKKGWSNWVICRAVNCNNYGNGKDLWRTKAC